jgi:hypothetical protein
MMVSWVHSWLMTWFMVLTFNNPWFNDDGGMLSVILVNVDHIGM